MLVKICGITNLTDALAAVEAGATALGFNFYSKSPRCITISTAAGIVRHIPPGILKVGVFVEDSADRVKAILDESGLDVAQVYRDEPYPGMRYWRGRRVDDVFSSSDLADSDAEAFLLDTAAPNMYGGSGKSFDWRRARGARCRVVIAGGLDESNVRQAIEQAQPWGVDACSRLESEPGRKDLGKMKKFVQAALAV